MFVQARRRFIFDKAGGAEVVVDMGRAFPTQCESAENAERILSVLRVNLTALGFGMGGELNLRLQMVLADTRFLWSQRDWPSYGKETIVGTLVTEISSVGAVNACRVFPPAKATICKMRLFSGSANSHPTCGRRPEHLQTPTSFAFADTALNLLTGTSWRVSSSKFHSLTGSMSSTKPPFASIYPRAPPKLQ